MQGLLQGPTLRQCAMLFWIKTEDLQGLKRLGVVGDERDTMIENVDFGQSRSNPDQTCSEYEKGLVAQMHSLYHSM